MKTGQGRLFSQSAASEKSKRNLAILNYIKAKGPVSSMDLLEQTQMSPAFLFSYLNDFVKAGLIPQSAGPFSENGSDRKVGLDTTRRVAGIGLGPDRIRAVICDLRNNVLARDSADMPVCAEGGSPEGAARETASLIESLARKSGSGATEITAVGIGSPNGEAEFLMSYIEEKFGTLCFFGNDAACAAFGERTANADASAENMLFMYSDTGCGIVVRDDIYFGSSGNAGGVQVNGDRPEFRYLRPWASELGLAEMARREASKGIGTRMVEFAGWNIGGITKNIVIEAAKAGDEVALDIIGYTGRNLGVRIAYLVNLFNPEAVFIGGGLEKAGELILEPIRETVGKLAFAEPAGAARILPSVVGEDAVPVGAASLAVRELFIGA